MLALIMFSSKPCHFVLGQLGSPVSLGAAQLCSVCQRGEPLEMGASRHHAAIAEVAP